MKILIEGKLPPKPQVPSTFRGTCLSCKCYVQCEIGEAKYGHATGTYFVDCPTPMCRQFIILNEKVYG